MVFSMTPTTPLDLLSDLEARQEDVLRQLVELDQRVEKTLAECQAYRFPIVVSLAGEQGFEP